MVALDSYWNFFLNQGMPQTDDELKPNVLGLEKNFHVDYRWGFHFQLAIHGRVLPVERHVVILFGSLIMRRQIIVIRG